MSSNSSGIPAGRLAQYAMLVASVPGLERRGNKSPYTSLNGNKSSFLTDTGSLALRLDPESRDAFIRDHQAQLCERHGRVMKEYVAVPEELWKERKALRKAFVSSVAYVGSLKPKVGKRKKTTAQPSAPADDAKSKTSVAKTTAIKKKAVPRDAASKKSSAKKSTRRRKAVAR